MKTVITAIALLLLTANVFAMTGFWTSSVVIDEMTDEKTINARVLGTMADVVADQDTLSGLGFSCRKDLSVTFYTSEVVASPGSKVTLHIRVDDYDAVQFEATMYRNSFNSGYVVIDRSNPIIQQMDSRSMRPGGPQSNGQVKVRVDSGSTVVNYKVGLVGFYDVII